MVQILRKNSLYFLILLLGIGLDQISKQIALKYLRTEDLVLIPKFLKFSLHFNEGIAFSIPIKNLFFPIIVIILLTFLLIYFKKTWLNLNDKITKNVLVLIYIGAISNIIDRLIHGKVIDFVAILSFPVFNLADTFITFGAILILFYQKRIFLDSTG